ncbi:MAG: hypothetical protein J7474_12570 [Arthrobacter sp.]|nr:hypothetical protein [Arthrobacter sp.]
MRVAASIVTIEHDHVLIRTREGHEWMLALQDVPPDLRREGQPISIEHDASGYATAITPRKPDPLPPHVQQRIDDVRRWAETL